MKMTVGDGDRRPEASHEARTRHGWQVFRVTTMGVMLTFLNTSSLNVAMPSVVEHFGIGPTAGSWILLSYMLVHVVFLMVFGALGDLIGRRRLYLFGLTMFSIACLGCAVAPNAEILIVLRVLQALGAAAVITNTTALLTDSFPSDKLAISLGLNTTMAAVAQVSGPLVGGAVATAFGWQAVFLFNIPFGLIALWLGWQYIQTDRIRTTRPFDWIGSVLFAAALGALLYLLSTIGIEGLGASGTQAALVGTLAFWPLLVWHESRTRYPMIDLGLFRQPNLAIAYVGSMTATACFAGPALLMALYLRTVEGRSAFSAGYAVMAFAVGMMVFAPLAGKLARTRPDKWRVAAFGIAVQAVGLIVLALLLGRGLPEPVSLALMFVAGGGYGAFMTPNTASIMLGAPPEKRGGVNGIRSVMANTGNVLGISIGLAIVALLLPAGAKSALYSGELGATPALGAQLTLGFSLALLFLGMAAAIVAVLTLRTGLRNPTNP